jgi:2,3-bisphosphoglycerate-independent phosphoglycerate mutase
MNKKRAMLIILDGCGEGKSEYGNAVYMAKTPCIDALKKDHSWSLVEPGGASVGVLPWQTGGSDVGHNTIGSGRIIRQPVKIIYDAIEDKSFFSNKKLIAAIYHAKKNNSNIHLFGIGSDSFIHSYTKFIYALLNLIKQENFPGDRVFLHLAADGRDNPPTSAINFLRS